MAPSVFPAQATSSLGTPASQGGGPRVGEVVLKAGQKTQLSSASPTWAWGDQLHTNYQAPLQSQVPGGLLSWPRHSLKLYHLGGTRTGPHSQSLRVPKAGTTSGPWTAPDAGCRDGHCLVTLLVPALFHARLLPSTLTPVPLGEPAVLVHLGSLTFQERPQPHAN